MQLNSEMLVAIMYLWSRDAHTDPQYVRSHLEQVGYALEEQGHLEFTDKDRERRCREMVRDWEQGKWSRRV